MSGYPTTHIDDVDYPLMTGTHDGADGAAILQDKGADFKSCGVDPDVGQLVKNTTDGSEGAVTAVTEDTITCTLAGGTNNTWSNGDTYAILKTGTEDTVLSTQYGDRRFGRKVTHEDQLTEDGYLLDDVDLDQDDDEVFGPGQPERIP